jgi:hypothetical protein
MKPRVQVREIALEVRLVASPRQPVHTGRGILLKLEEHLVQQVDVDVVEERGEPFLFPFLRYLPYALQRL